MNRLFNRKELVLAQKICRTTDVGQRDRALVEQIIQPAISRINRATGEENDPHRLAHMLEFLADTAEHYLW